MDSTLAQAIVDLQRIAAERTAAAGIRWPGVWIISGHRSAELQATVNPSAPRSKHVRCPALAVDLRVGDAPASLTDPLVWKWLGDIWHTLGGRWGGDFRPIDPREFNHFEMMDIERPFDGPFVPLPVQAF